MSSNFSFLADKYQDIEKIASLAEGYLYTDPNTCLLKLGLIGEIIVNHMIALDGIQPPVTNTHADRIKLLKCEGMLPTDIDNILYELRTNRNRAAHDGYDSLTMMPRI